jgi:hypothetical protein
MSDDMGKQVNNDKLRNNKTELIIKDEWKMT